MADQAKPLKDKHGRVTGYKGSKADTYVEPTKPKEGGIAGEAPPPAAEAAPKRSDFPPGLAGAAQWNAAIKKWRDRTAAQGAAALGESKK